MKKKKGLSCSFLLQSRFSASFSSIYPFLCALPEDGEGLSYLLRPLYTRSSCAVLSEDLNKIWAA